MMKYVFAVAITMLAGAAVAQQAPNAPPAGESMSQPMPAPGDTAAPQAPGMGQPAPGMAQPDAGVAQPAPGMSQPDPAMSQPAPAMDQPGQASGSTMAAAPAPAPAPGNLPMCSRTVRDSCQQSAAMERRAISAAQAERRIGRRGTQPPM